MLAITAMSLLGASPAPDLSGYLAPAPAGDWVESSPSQLDLVGVITAHSYSLWTADNGASERALNRDGFVGGYGREWTQKLTQNDLHEFVLEFSNDDDATSWYNGLKRFDQTSKYYKKDIPAVSTSRSVGVQWIFEDGVHEYAIEFAKGNLFFDVTMDAANADLAAATLAQAQLEFDGAPAEADVPAAPPLPPPSPAVIAIALVFIALVTGSGVVLLMRSSRRREAPAFASAGVHYSPDGHYWWDGASWRAVASDPPPRPG